MTADGPVKTDTDLQVRKVDFRGIKGIIGAHVGDLYSFGSNEFFRPDGMWENIKRVWGFGSDESASESKGTTYTGKEHYLSSEGYRITSQAKIMSLISFSPLDSPVQRPPNDSMVRTIEAAVTDLSTGAQEIITALIVQELERRDEEEENLKAIGLHGLFGSGKKKKQFSARPRDVPMDSEPELPSDNDTARWERREKVFTKASTSFRTTLSSGPPWGSVIRRLSIINGKVVEDIQINGGNRDSYNFTDIIPEDFKPKTEQMELVTVLWYSRSKAENYGMINEELVSDPMSPPDITMYRSLLMQVLYIS